MNGLMLLLGLLALAVVVLISATAALLAVHSITTIRHPDPTVVNAAFDRARRRATGQPQQTCPEPPATD